MPSRTVETVFRMKHDRAAARALLRDQDRIDDALKDTARSSARVEGAYTDQEQAAKRLAASQRQLADAQIKTARESADIYGDVASRTSAISGLASGLGGGALGGRLMIAADILDAVEASKLLRAELPAMVSQLGLSASSMAALGLAAGAMVAAFLVVKNVLGEIIDAGKEVQQEIQGRINALKSYYEFIADATSEELESRIAELEQRRSMNAQLALDLLALKEAVENGLDAASFDNLDVLDVFGEGALRAMDALGLMGFGLDELKTAIEETRTAMKADEIERKLLTQAYTEGATATADARQQELDFTSQKIAALEREAQQQIKNAELIRTGTGEQLALRQQQIETELEAYRTLESELEPLISESDEAAQKLAETKDAIFLLEEESKNLTNNIMAEVAAREIANATLERAAQLEKERQDAAAVHITEFNASMEAVSATFAEGREQAIAYAAAQAEADDKRQRVTLEEQADFERKRLLDLADHYADMAQLDADYFRDREDILNDLGEDLGDLDQQRLDDVKDYNKASRRLAEDHRDRLLSIQRQADNDYMDAARNRDTAGALAALRNGKEQLEDEDRQYQKEQKRREVDFKDQLDLLARERRERQKAAAQQLRELAQQHQRERQARQQAFRQQLSREDQERAIRLQRLQQQYQREDTQRSNHFTTVESATSQHFSDVQGRTSTGFANLEANYAAHLTRLNQLVTSGSGSAARPIGSGYTPEQYAAGGRPPLRRVVSVGERRPETAIYAGGRREIVGRHGSELALFNRPVRIYPSAAASQGGSRVSLNLGGVNVQAGSGMSARDVARMLAAQVEDKVYGVLDKMVSEAEL